MAHINLTDRLMLASLALVLAMSLVIVPENKVQPDTREVLAPVAHQPAPKMQVAREARVVPAPAAVPSSLPDFASITDVRKKKQAFFSYLLPKVRLANQKIREERRYLLDLRDEIRMASELALEDVESVRSMARSYRVSDTRRLEEMIDKLLLRVDVIPESLVLAQAANESGWGTSRFARKANNLFGVWCFTPGCGLEPLQRDAGLTHEVARYDSVQLGIEAYLHTLNTNAAYVELRHIRAGSREEQQLISGLAMAEGLLRYSARGADYVREIQAMIRVNNLQRYNLPVKA